MDDGSVIHLKLTINGNKGEGIFNFSGTSTEVHGNLNAPEAVTAAAVIYCLRCLVDVIIPLNQGCLAPVKTHIPAVLLQKVFMGSSNCTNLLSPVNFGKLDSFWNSYWD
ncbi:hypothetical protein ACFE04_014827 [Oxalis oulophora]